VATVVGATIAAVGIGYAARQLATYRAGYRVLPEPREVSVSQFEFDEETPLYDQPSGSEPSVGQTTPLQTNEPQGLRRRVFADSNPTSNSPNLGSAPILVPLPPQSPISSEEHNQSPRSDVSNLYSPWDLVAFELLVHDLIHEPNVTSRVNAGAFVISHQNSCFTIVFDSGRIFHVDSIGGVLSGAYYRDFPASVETPLDYNSGIRIYSDGTFTESTDGVIVSFVFDDHPTRFHREML